MNPEQMFEEYSQRVEGFFRHMHVPDVGNALGEWARRLVKSPPTRDDNLRAWAFMVAAQVARGHCQTNGAMNDAIHGLGREWERRSHEQAERESVLRDHLPDAPRYAEETLDCVRRLPEPMREVVLWVYFLEGRLVDFEPRDGRASRTVEYRHAKAILAVGGCLPEKELIEFVPDSKSGKARIEDMLRAAPAVAEAARQRREGDQNV